MLEEHQQIRFTQLWTDAQPTVSQYVASLIRDQWAVGDIMQSTSLALLQKFSEYNDSRPFLPWALGVAKFEILGHRRNAARNRMICDSEFIEMYTQAWAEIAPRMSDEAAALRHCVGELKAVEGTASAGTDFASATQFSRAFAKPKGTQSSNDALARFAITQLHYESKSNGIVS
ncbi:RNA polymerase sigma factor [Stieleria neptunia]|uniref:RNA polymerase sigma factor n=1 Tax=Stieleria neptunia TaxID=2527979 RepID=A0A518HWB5_9BACT|nr:sigma factor [Stieleria neptunia]QDV45097.1 RNA polymerase sigma factor [Stieleria neptunia]